MTAILSDIHADLEALEAVMADIAGRRVDAVHCLGDTPDDVATTIWKVRRSPDLDDFQGDRLGEGR